MILKGNIPPTGVNANPIICLIHQLKTAKVLKILSAKTFNILGKQFSIACSGHLAYRVHQRQLISKERVNHSTCTRDNLVCQSLGVPVPFLFKMSQRYIGNYLLNCSFSVAK